MNTQSYGYIAALFISLLGSSLSMVAFPWFLLETTGDVKYTSIILGFRLLPVTLTLFYGTKFIDRFSRKSICVVSDLISAILVIAIPVLYSVSMLNMGILLFTICSLTAIEQINQAGLGAMIPDILKNASISNERFNGIIGSLHNFGDLAGPSLAGVIIVLAGSTMALVLNGVTFLVSSVILLVFIKSVPTTPDRNDKASASDGLKESFSFIFSNPRTRYVIIPSILVNFLIFPLISLVLPYLAKNSISSVVGLGFMISSFGGGALFSSLIFAAIGNRFSKSWLLITCTLILAICFFLMVFAGNVYIIIGLLFFVGLSVGLMGPLDDTILQTSTPEQILGRVLLAYSFLRFVTIPFAMVLFGFLLGSTSIENTFFYMVALLGITLVWLLANRRSYEAAQ
ncbi:MFS transporter [Xenorhabdus littoralis]|uniref:MFS transporter n=1 Tax=Xenorhabdus littoralis TaxID=2582835 RepID=UPI0029E7DB5C|nr:MFS transporter [Xenorhabdus sp. psl]